MGETLPSTTGFTIIQANLPAVVQNTGLEVELNTINIKTPNFSWNSSINLTIPRNVLVSFPGLATNPSYQSRYAIGKSLFINSDYHYTGINPQTGLYTFQDVNGDGVLNGSDRQFIAPITQNYFGGFQNAFAYKNFRLDVFLQFVKQTGSNYLKAFSRPGVLKNLPASVLDNVWTSSGDVALIQRYGNSSAVTSAYSSLQSSDASVSDASFIRLKNVSLSYNLPAGLQRRLNLKNASIFISAQNLLVITGYSGLDPENTSLSLPPLRMITSGIHLSL